MPIENLNVKNVSLEQLLNTALKGKNLTYKIEDNIVYLSQASKQQDPVQASAKRQISGTVVDANGEALIGVNVSVKGTSTGAITDLEGKYTLTVNDPKAEIVFSYIGYQTQKIAVGGKTKIDVKLGRRQPIAAGSCRSGLRRST